MSENDDDYEVGYGKPPKGTRFKKGQSGNPKGRRPAAESRQGFSESLEDILETTTVITENGVRREITLMDAMGRRLVTDAINGDRQAMRTSLGFFKHFGVGKSQRKPPPEEDRNFTVHFISGPSGSHSSDAPAETMPPEPPDKPQNDA